MPAPPARRRSAVTGRTSAVGLVTWSSMTSRVRGPTASSTAARAASGVASGNGIRPSRARAGRVRDGLERVARGGVRVVEQLVARLEAEAAGDDVDAGGGVGDEGEVVGVGAEEGAEGRRASSSAGSRSRAKKATGSRSIRSRHASCAASTGRGVAPDP